MIFQTTLMLISLTAVACTLGTAAPCAAASAASAVSTAAQLNAPSRASAARLAPASSADHDQPLTLEVARFGNLAVYRPTGAPKSVAIFLSGDGGWELGVLGMARALRSEGALVIGVDVRRYLASLAPSDAAQARAPCHSLAVDLEELSHRVQKQLGLKEYHVPVLLGYSSGATVAYAALAQSPPGTFAGAISLGFCADQDFNGATLCPGAGLHGTPAPHHELLLAPASHLRQPWVVLQGEQDQVCPLTPTADFVAHIPAARLVQLPRVGHGFSVERNWLPQLLQTYRSLTPAQTAAAPRASEVGDLPLEEVTSAPTAPAAPLLAILLTGDGGWAGLDEEIAARLASRGVPTVALNSLKYFWSRRSPEETARDVERISSHYLTAWSKERVLLIGYSFGADVLPFVVNRLTPELRARVASLSLLGLDGSAAFEISIGEWIGSDGERPTLPELEALRGERVLCVFGAGESDSLCPALGTQGLASVEKIGAGHHFSGEYAAIADAILQFAARR